jgi:hypothetical protein
MWNHNMKKHILGVGYKKTAVPREIQRGAVRGLFTGVLMFVQHWWAMMKLIHLLAIPDIVVHANQHI